MHDQVAPTKVIEKLDELRSMMSKFKTDFLNDLPLWRIADPDQIPEDAIIVWKDFIERDWTIVDDHYVMQHIDMILDLSTQSFLYILADLLRVSVVYIQDDRLGAEVFHSTEALLCSHSSRLSQICSSVERSGILIALQVTTSWIFEFFQHVSVSRLEYSKALHRRLAEA